MSGVVNFLLLVLSARGGECFPKIKNRKIFVDFVGKCNKVCPFKFMGLLSAEFFRDNETAFLFYTKTRK